MDTLSITFKNQTFNRNDIYQLLNQYSGLIVDYQIQMRKIQEESNTILKEIPVLISWVDKKLATPLDLEFEKRLETFRNKLK